MFLHVDMYNLLNKQKQQQKGKVFENCLDMLNLLSFYTLIRNREKTTTETWEIYEWAIHKRRTYMANKYMKKCSTISETRKFKIKNQQFTIFFLLIVEDFIKLIISLLDYRSVK